MSIMNCATYYLGEEILIEILARLPAKSLVRFMAVCQLWKSIITSPQFRLQCPTTKLLVHSDQQCHALDENLLVVSETTDFPFKHKAEEVVGSHNGLVCIRIYEKEKRPPNIIIIWNPSIRKHAVIPPAPMNPCVLLVDGFGATISDYKYVRIVSFLVDLQDNELVLPPGAVEIYSWKTGAWRRINLDFDLYRGKFFLPACVSLRGRLHWTVCDQPTRRIFHSTNSISSFDLEEEVFVQDILLPSECFECRVNLFAIKESLAVIVDEREPPNCSVWVMQEYGNVNSWTKLYRVDTTAMTNMIDVDWALHEFGAGRGDIRVLVSSMVHLLENGELLLGLEMVVGHRERMVQFPPKLVKYNPKTRTTTDIRGVSDALSDQFCGFTNSYKESLVFLNHDHRVHADQEVLSHVVE